MNADNLCEATNYTGNDTCSMSVGSRGARWTILCTMSILMVELLSKFAVAGTREINLHLCERISTSLSICYLSSYPLSNIIQLLIHNRCLRRAIVRRLWARGQFLVPQLPILNNNTKRYSLSR